MRKDKKIVFCIYACFILYGCGADQSGSGGIPSDPTTDPTNNPTNPITDQDAQNVDRDIPNATQIDIDNQDLIDPNIVDPCQGVPTWGVCNGNNVRVCVASSGNGQPEILNYNCSPDESCVQDSQGARCELSANCYSGAAECIGDTLSVCEQGYWIELPCASGCVESALGANCRPFGTTQTYQGRLLYEAKSPNDQYTDWNPTPFQSAAPGFLIMSFTDGNILDSTTTDNEGNFTIQAPTTLDGDDFLAAFAAAVDSTGEIKYAVGNPGLSPGNYIIDQELNFPDASVWFWTWTPNDIPTGEDVILPINSGSGAARLFDYARFTYENLENFYGPRTDTPLIIWLGNGVTWSCGACFAPYPINPFEGRGFNQQIWMPGGSDETYWSDAVTAHEIGHYVMSTYGTSPGEGGKHIIGIPSHPGLAWSEGWATWFSSLVRNSPLYYDKQEGGMLWLDLSQRVYSGDKPWYFPSANSAYGLGQLIDEHEVAAMLLRLTTEQSFAGILGALSSPRMNQSPFLRGYQRRTWELDAQGWPIVSVNSTGISAPHFADFLDALICNQVVSPEAVGAVTEPDLYYPYPHWSPICQ